ncbi:DUF3306 domain-containing protein [Vreelandella olivaria]|uniref:DUF3306 domain-containing protein n=1 Tax=Vreelandella olivaria TaxID=390919 RepID=UPI00201E864C
MNRLQQWSRKKRGVESEDDAERGASDTSTQEVVARGAHAKEADEDAEHASQQVAQEDQEQPPAPGSLDHTLPDPDTLLPGSDFSVFMAAGVSASLRRRALKRLWATGNYNVRDGLDDYDADYRQQLKPMANELAGKLRQWANKVEEGLERPTASEESGHCSGGGTDQSECSNSHVQEASPLQEEGLDSQNVATSCKIDERIKSS